MGRAPCCDKANVKKGPWSPEEDAKLKEYIEKYGTGGNWITLPQKAGLRRCGKSCRLRWLNYLRPNIKHGEFSDEEDRIICSLFATIGSRWSIIAAQLPGRTDNDIKNYWNTKLKKKLMGTPGTPNKKTQQASIAYHPTTTTRSTSAQPASSSTSLFQVAVSPSPPCQYHYSPDTHFNQQYPSPMPLTSLTEHQPSLLGNTSNTLSSYQAFQCTQDDQYPSTMQNYLMFGGGEPSCCSSDHHGSFGKYRNISYERDLIGYEYGSPPPLNGEKLQGMMQQDWYLYQEALMLRNGEAGRHGFAENNNLESGAHLVDAGVLLEEESTRRNDLAEKPISEELINELEMISKMISNIKN